MSLMLLLLGLHLLSAWVFGRVWLMSLLPWSCKVLAVAGVVQCCLMPLMLLGLF